MSSIAIAGLGNVGMMVYKIARNVGIPIVSVSDSSGWISLDGVSDAVHANIVSKDRKGKLATIQGVKVSKSPILHKDTIICDTTGSDATIKHLVDAITNGNKVVLANKKPLTSDIKTFEHLTQDSEAIRFSSTVGAGLPMVNTLRRLRDAGDKIKRVEGAFSGTLGYVLTGLQNKRPFSEIVAEAKSLGYTEPDPRDDLSGTDVGRKALIISRCLGSSLEMKDVQIEPLYPPEFAKLSVDEFMKRLPELDNKMKERVAQSEKKGCNLRYAAVIDNYGSSCKVGLVDAPADGSSALGTLAGTNNLMEISSLYYSRESGSSPLVIRGPGAGAQVTAAGVIADAMDLPSPKKKTWVR